MDVPFNPLRPRVRRPAAVAGSFFFLSFSPLSFFLSPFSFRFFFSSYSLPCCALRKIGFVRYSRMKGGGAGRERVLSGGHPAAKGPWGPRPVGAAVFGCDDTCRPARSQDARRNDNSNATSARDATHRAPQKPQKGEPQWGTCPYESIHSRGLFLDLLLRTSTFSLSLSFLFLCFLYRVWICGE